MSTRNSEHRYGSEWDSLGKPNPWLKPDYDATDPVEVIEHLGDERIPEGAKVFGTPIGNGWRAEDMMEYLVEDDEFTVETANYQAKSDGALLEIKVGIDPGGLHPGYSQHVFWGEFELEDDCGLRE